MAVAATLLTAKAQGEPPLPARRVFSSAVWDPPHSALFHDDARPGLVASPHAPGFGSDLHPFPDYLHRKDEFIILACSWWSQSIQKNQNSEKLKQPAGFIAFDSFQENQHIHSQLWIHTRGCKHVVTLLGVVNKTRYISLVWEMR